jgi:hypothetical protein
MGKEFHPDHSAVAWWSSLTSIAEMIDRQRWPLTKPQLEYLRSTLFGGMGSFQDWSLEQQSYGSDATNTNKRLEKLRSELFRLL